MINARPLFFLLILSFSQLAESQVTTDGIYAVFETNKGKITVLLDQKNAPMTVANFVGLAEGTLTNATYPIGKPFFSGSIWHRVVKGHVIQGGEPSVIKDPANFEGNSLGYMIPNEISALSHNKAGMIGMANGGPHTNTSQYYITLGDRSYLDGNYTLFGEVAEGMDVVNKIEQGDTTFSVKIVRRGFEAERYVVNDVVLKELIDRQWQIVKQKKELKQISDEKFIADNYPGLIKLPGGLRYKDLSKGKGTVPSDSSILKVSYTGKLTTGISFASTSNGGKPEGVSKPETFIYKKGAPGLIKGIQTALSDMKAGQKRVIVIPPELGYGQNAGFYGKSTPGQKRFVISPGETLIIELTLEKISRR
jgi:cyclophilin family peptidyl-prolyl cis-trans isomerase